MRLTVAPTRRTLLLLQHAQQLGLRARRQVGDFIQKQRPAVGLLDQAGAVGDRPGEGALGMAKELGLEQVIGQRRAIDIAKAPFAPRAELMQGAGNELLTGS